MTTEPFLPRAVAHTATARTYGRFPAVGANGAVRIAAEVPLMFAAFVLGVPMFAVIIERGEEDKPAGQSLRAGLRVRFPLSLPTPPSPEIGDTRCGSRTGRAGCD
jgi:hypothetical protein